MFCLQYFFTLTQVVLLLITSNFTQVQIQSNLGTTVMLLLPVLLILLSLIVVTVLLICCYCGLIAVVVDDGIAIAAVCHCFRC